MKSMNQLLSLLHALDIKLWVEGERLRYNAPPGALSPDLRADLVENKAELVSMLQQLYAHETSLLPRKHENNTPLSFAQQRLWFLDQSGNGSASVYFICAALRLTGVLNVPALHRTLQAAINRHEVLRTIAFATVNGGATQVIAPEVELRLPMTDLCELPTGKREQEIHHRVRENIRTGFDLTRGPFIRFALLKLNEQEHVLLINTHQIVSDAWSFQILVKEIMTLYTADVAGQPNPLPPRTIQYADYAVWHRTWLKSEASRKQIDYWQRQLKDLPAFLALPTDFPRPVVQTFAGRSHDFMICVELAERLKALSQTSDATIFMTLVSAFAILLSRYSGQTVLAIGTPVANRARQEVEDLIGFFVNTLVLRADVAPNHSFNKLLNRMKQICLEAYAHQEVPFEYLLEELKPARVAPYSPLFQVMFVLQKNREVGLKLPGLRIESLGIEQTLAKCDLILKITESTGELPCSFEYNTDLFRLETMQQMARHFMTLLEGIVSDPEKPVNVLPLPIEAGNPDRKTLTAWKGLAPVEIHKKWNQSAGADQAIKQLSSYENLVLLRKGTPDNKNLFFIHDGCGDIGGYLELCGTLDPTFHYWGIKTAAEHKYYPRKLSIPKLSKTYIENLSRIQPHDPYYLAGWSVGGSIAFEMARQLEQMNCKVATLILFDSPPPVPKPELKNNPFDVQTEKQLIQTSLDFGAFLNELTGITALNELWAAVIKRCETDISKEFLLKALKKNISEEWQYLLTHYEYLDGKEIIYHLNTLRSFSYARDVYIPQSKMNAEVHFFKAKDSSHANERDWNSYCHKSVNIHFADGNHFTMFHLPHKTKLINQLNTILGKR